MFEFLLCFSHFRALMQLYMKLIRGRWEMQHVVRNRCRIIICVVLIPPTGTLGCSKVGGRRGVGPPPTLGSEAWFQDEQLRVLRSLYKCEKWALRSILPLTYSLTSFQCISTSPVPGWKGAPRPPSSALFTTTQGTTAIEKCVLEHEAGAHK